MKVDLLHYTPLEIAVEAIRTCYNSMSKSDNLGEKDKSLIRKIIKAGHDSTVEHIVYTWRIHGISRVTLAQLTRHRLASYSVQSHRYTTPTDYVMPPTVAQALKKLSEDEDFDIIDKDYFNHLIWTMYDNLIDMGVPREDARYFLPQAVTTNLIMTINARSLRNFFKLRLDKHAQWEIRTLAENMYLKLPLEHRLTIFYDIDLGR